MRAHFVSTNGVLRRSGHTAISTTKRHTAITIAVRRTAAINTATELPGGAQEKINLELELEMG
jgi:hypothetical protein